MTADTLAAPSHTVVSRAEILAGSARKARSRKRVRRTLLNGVAGLFVVVWIFPVYWMLNTALKRSSDIFTSTPKFLPFPISLDSFAAAIGKANFFLYLRNSVIVALAAVVVSIGIAFLAAVGLTRYRFTGRKAYLMGIIIVQMIPGTALLIPLFLSLKSVGLLNNLFGLVLTYVSMVLPFCIWTLRGFVLGVPGEVEEAAMVDGAGRWTVIRKVIFPLVVPGVISTSIFAFITAWNDYLYAYVMMKDQVNYTLPVWLVSFRTAAGTDYGGQIAASVLFSLPVIIFFMIIQRRLVTGITAGAVKG